jgi:hypothetical protein
MVMPADQQEMEQPAEYMDTPDTDVDEGLSQPEDTGGEDTGGATVESAPLPSAAPSGEVPAAPPAARAAQPAQVDQRAIQELHQRRALDNLQSWRDQVGQTARQYEQRLTQSGYTPAMARDQARRYVQQEQKIREHEHESAEMLGFIEGRQMAATHYLEKLGLADKQMIADLRTLQQTNTPAEMEKEARRIKEDRSLRAENARLKQGQVPAQTFDNSQGSASASSNDQRLLDAYIAGDRSEAATAAVRRMMQG